MIRIGFFGDSGSGKSTLLNALLDADGLLPAGDFFPQTVLPIWICHSPDNKYHIRMKPHQSAHEAVGRIPNDILREAIRNRKWEIWINRLLSGAKTLDDLVAALHDPQALQQSIQQALAIPDVFSAVTELNSFLVRISETFPWALFFESVTVSGPFNIAPGMAYLDSPGFNDPNPLHEWIARKHFEAMDVHCLVYRHERVSDTTLDMLRKLAAHAVRGHSPEILLIGTGSHRLVTNQRSAAGKIPFLQRLNSAMNQQKDEIGRLQKQIRHQGSLMYFITAPRHYLQMRAGEETVLDAEHDSMIPQLREYLKSNFLGAHQ